ncbi:MAG TPA: hypothetical protein V6D12_14430 [Candidatus Obscuribacterales bacterium]
MVNTQDKNGQKITPRLEQNLNDFMKSLSDALMHITALEVNTMVVEQITANKFIPWQVYRDVYPISREYLEGRGIHKSLRDRYLSLRQQLEIEYCLILTEDNPTAIQDCRILTDPTVSLEDIQTQLPNPVNPAATPTEIRTIQNLLDDGRFLRPLRKIGELKAALDNQNKALTTTDTPQSTDTQKGLTTDLIYAQTIVQLDGDIINRFDKQLLDSEYKELILQLHQEGVRAGDTQWRGLLEFLVNLVQSMLVQGGSIKSLLGRN